MDKKQLKEIIKKESFVFVAFFLTGMLVNFLFPCLYKYYISHFSTRSSASYTVALLGWWFLILVGYFLSIFVRYGKDKE
jgi:hypothetical protein